LAVFMEVVENKHFSVKLGFWKRVYDCLLSLKTLPPLWG